MVYFIATFLNKTGNTFLMSERLFSKETRNIVDIPIAVFLVYPVEDGYINAALFHTCFIFFRKVRKLVERCNSLEKEVRYLKKKIKAGNTESSSTSQREVSTPNADELVKSVDHLSTNVETFL